MPKVLDTNVLLNHWHAFTRGKVRTPSALREHAEALVEREGTNLILSPVEVEFLAGARADELDHTKAFLGAFYSADEGRVPPQDWEEAKRLAAWDRGRSRKLGDCLIAAIAKRLKLEIVSRDRDIHPRVGPRAGSTS
jgi:predicted nucleic acid-binding protein